MSLALSIYASGAIIAAAVLLIGDEVFVSMPRELGSEGKALLRVGLALVWPSLALGLLICAGLYLARGVAQLYRFAVPKRIAPPNLPKAQVRR